VKEGNKERQERGKILDFLSPRKYLEERKEGRIFPGEGGKYSHWKTSDGVGPQKSPAGFSHEKGNQFKKEGGFRANQNRLGGTGGTEEG